MRNLLVLFRFIKSIFLHCFFDDVEDHAAVDDRLAAQEPRRSVHSGDWRPRPNRLGRQSEEAIAAEQRRCEVMLTRHYDASIECENLLRALSRERREVNEQIERLTMDSQAGRIDDRWLSHVPVQISTFESDIRQIDKSISEYSEKRQNSEIKIKSLTRRIEDLRAESERLEAEAYEELLRQHYPERGRQEPILRDPARIRPKIVMIRKPRRQRIFGGCCCIVFLGIIAWAGVVSLSDAHTERAEPALFGLVGSGISGDSNEAAAPGNDENATDLLVSYGEGETIKLELPGVPPWNTHPCTSDLSSRETLVRLDVYDLYTLEKFELSGLVTPDSKRIASVEIAEGTLPASKYRLDYYAEVPVCMYVNHLDDVPDEIPISERPVITNMLGDRTRTEIGRFFKSRSPDYEGVSLSSSTAGTVTGVNGNIFYRSHDLTQWRYDPIHLPMLVLVVFLAIVVGIVVVLQKGEYLPLAVVFSTGIVFLLGFLLIIVLLPSRIGHAEGIVENVIPVGWENPQVVKNGDLLESIYFPSGMDIDRQIFDLHTTVSGFRESGTTEFAVLSSLVKDLEVTKTVFTEDELIEVSAVVTNTTDAEIEAVVTLSCQNGYSSDGSISVLPGAFEKVTFPDVVLPVGSNICVAHGNAIELTVEARPFLSFNQSAYAVDLGDEFSINGSTNLSEGEQVLLSIGKKVREGSVRELLREVVVVGNSVFEMSIDTDDLPEGALEIRIFSADASVEATVPLELTRRFAAIEVQGITVSDPTGLHIVGDLIEGVITAKNSGNATWTGSLDVFVNGQAVSHAGGVVEAQGIEDIPFSISVSSPGSHRIEAGGEVTFVSVSAIPYIETEVPWTAIVGLPFNVNISTNIPSGDLRTILQKDGTTVDSTIRKLDGPAIYSFSFIPEQTGVYIVASESSLDLARHLVKDIISIDVYESDAGVLIYELYPEPSNVIRVGTEASLRLVVQNTTGFRQRVPIRVEVDTRVIREQPTYVQPGIEIVHVPLGLLDEGYHTVSVDGRVRQIHVVPLDKTIERTREETGELIVSLHADKTLVGVGESVVVNARVANLKPEYMDVQLIVSVPSGMSVHGGTCHTNQCSKEINVPPKGDGGLEATVVVVETSTIELFYSYVYLGQEVDGKVPGLTLVTR